MQSLNSITQLLYPVDTGCHAFRLIQLGPYFVCAQSECSGDTSHMRMLVLAFVDHICYPSYLIYVYSLYVRK